MPLLYEDHPIYARLGVFEAEFIRARLMAALGGCVPLAEALPLILEDLATSDRAYPLAAAAMALMAYDAVPADTTEHLREALLRLQGRDRQLDLGGSTSNATSLIREAIARCEAGGRAGTESGGSTCCAGRKAVRELPVDQEPLRIEDQNGEDSTLGEILRGRAAFLAFFYTRCMNPQMCSATVARLGALAEVLRRADVEATFVVLGMTYDPDFDTSARLEAYGSSRGMVFSDTVRLVRAKAGVEAMIARFAPSVGYGPKTVNRHALEALVIGGDERIVTRFDRAAWTVDQAVDALSFAAGASADGGAA